MEFWGVSKNLPVIEVQAKSEEDFKLGQKMRHADAERALEFVMNLAVLGPQDWAVERVVVENFYTLHVQCNDGVEARFSMYEHDFQLQKLMLVREHAAEKGKRLAWIDLRPKTNNPGGYVDGDGLIHGGATPLQIAEPASPRGDGAGVMDHGNVHGGGRGEA